MNHATTTEDLDRERRYWLADNSGILTRIAEQVGAAHPYVTDMFYGRRKGNTPLGAAIRAALRRAGAPGFHKKAA